MHAFSGVVVVVVVNSDPWFVSDLIKKMQEVEGLCMLTVCQQCEGLHGLNPS